MTTRATRATDDAGAALHLLLEARMRRRLFTVVDATNVSRAAREPLVAAAKRHYMLPIAVMIATPGSVCIERQGPRPANRTVPEDVVVKQRKDMVDPHRTLKAEGFSEVLFSDSLYRLLPFLERFSGARQADLGLDGGDGLGDLSLVARVFGEVIVPLWQWKPGLNLAGGDRVAEIRLGQQYLTVALRTDVDGEGDVGFDVMVPCPHDDECTGRAWVPAYHPVQGWRLTATAAGRSPQGHCLRTCGTSHRAPATQTKSGDQQVVPCPDS